jgi:hypothetical protein
MPILDIDSTEAFRNFDHRAHSRWLQVAGEGVSDPIGSPFFRPALRKTFLLKQNPAGFVLGPCFAQQIQFALGRHQIPLRSSILDAPVERWFLQYSMNYWPMHFFHRFNPRSMLLEIENILSANSSIANGDLIFERADGSFADFHYDWRFPLATPQECVERRTFVRERINALIDVDFAILNLGLVESWFDHGSGLYLNAAPTPDLLERFPDRFRLHVLNELDVVESVTRIVELLSARLTNLKLVLMVSPIPLRATFTGVDVAIANANSKATLICAANRVLAAFPQMFYFPAYEMVTLSDRSTVWEPDGRHVRQDFIDRTMDLFCEQMIDNG